ncbi:fatty acid synthase-like [Ochlerotatus camptorhynchus]|uniref:fatty acid synthase-like n=1 Tax=Ochlerotatus camptorhynchus TaxID=644619 RepID=UPI0031D8BCFE
MPSREILSVGTGESVVISGIAGRFPQSDNVREFARNLYEKRDLVDDKETRWKHTMRVIPRRLGKINNLEKFDREFFGYDRRQRDTMDPQQWMTLEHAFEAVLDAGVNPEILRGSRTGVFCGVCFSEVGARMYCGTLGYAEKGMGLSGYVKSLIAHRVSYMMDLKGPSFVIDTACSSSMYALDVAYRSMMNGDCDAAIVTGSNLTLHPFITYQFALLGVLAKDGFCRPFDKDATGYARSEAVCAVFLQKAKDAKRIYGHVIHSKTNCDGFKSEGITYPSGLMQQQLLTEFYDEVGISPTEVDYVEAHSTGTFVGDPEECNAIDKVYCTGRDGPLLVGSVKSSIGHSEASAGVCSIAKCIIAMENDMIPPNINFTEYRPTIPSLAEGRLKVVSDTMPLLGPLIGINSFGFGGANAHALLCRNLKEKKNHGVPEDDLPRLVVWSGRTREAIEYMFQDITQRPLDAEFIALLCNVEKQGIPGHRYRGFGVYRKDGEKLAILEASRIERVKIEPLPVVAVFGGINLKWRQELHALKRFSVVEKTFTKCNGVLQTLKFDLNKKLSGNKSILYNMVGSTVLQLSIVDLLSSVGVKFDLYGGHSVGQFTCAYIDRSLNLEQVLRLAFWHGLVYSDCQAVCDYSAFVRMTSKLNQLPLKNIFKDNASTFGIIVGTEDTVIEQIHQFKATGFSAELLSYLSFHSIHPWTKSLPSNLRQTVNTVLSRVVVPTNKWITGTLPQTSSIFHSPNLHNEASIVNLFEKIPKHTHVIEFGCSLSCKHILRMLNRNSSYLPSGSESTDAVGLLLSKIGHLHLASQNLDIARLYPKVQFPVSRGTPMISPLIRWDHREDAFVVKYNWEQTNKSRAYTINISLNNQDFKYIEGHNIDGRVLFPATGYLKLVWEHVAYLEHNDLEDFAVEFEDIRFLRATTMTKGQTIQFTVSIQTVTGFFEIVEGDSVVVTGFVRSLKECINNDFSDTASSAVVLPTKDFYKELRLRGYYYSGLFKSVLEARSDGMMAKIQWKDNWVAFLDCLLQVGIIAADSRLLMVPTAIEKLSISPRAHISMIEKSGDDCEFFTVRSCVDTNTLVCGAVAICNLRASSIGRRNPPGIPVLETYQFVPYHAGEQVSSSEAIRMIVQLALENVPTLTVNVTEIYDDSHRPIVQLFGEAIADLPLVQSNLTLLSVNEMELDNVTVKNERLSDQSNQLIVVLDSKMNNAEFLKEVDESLEETGFIIVRERIGCKRDEFCKPEEFNMVASFQVDQEESFICLQRKSKGHNETPEIIRVDSTDMSWLAELKQFSKLRSTILYSQIDSVSGVIGLVNCIRKEPKMHSIRCVLIDDPKAPEFTVNDPFYKNQLDLGLAFNILLNGVWGSYRHTLLPKMAKTEPVSKHCYANSLTKGDLSSIMWFTGAFNEWDVVPNKVNVSYCTLNFRDVMVATGRLSSDVSSFNRLEGECELGYEYAGVTDDGRRVIGVLPAGALSTVVSADPYLVWTIPDSWSLEDACTVPIVYGTVLTAFTVSAHVRKGQSVLIHAGSGGVGLAAINMAFAYGLEVFTTVGTEEKVKFLLSEFPALKPENIGNSRDLSFEQMIKLRTNGRGVDYVLNSLAEEKLQASVRCLANGGHFLEIGKYDMARDSRLSMQLFKKGITFTSVMLDAAMRDSPELKKNVNDLLRTAIQDGVVKPLKTTVFDARDLEKAMRFLASGKHTGKIVIKLRENETDVETLPISYFPKVFCNPDQVYIIIGGLGGFGLELTDWLVLRGCKKLVFSSSRGITKPYQQYRIKIWNSYGVHTHVCTADITSMDGCRTLLKEASRFGAVAAIYNLAVQLRDAILENQSVEMFVECMAPKAKATEYLDIASRLLCPQLKHFVVFSSVSCGRGNAGQSNYGMANSVMERIIERRCAEGLPGKAIQWGAIGEVGLVADMAEDKVDMVIGGTLQQRISSCLLEMDFLLTCENPLVASMVVAEKRKGSGSKNIIEAVMNIMCIRDLKSVSMESSLADIGMDSLMAVEIKQVLERDFDMVLSPQDLRTLTFAKLLKMEEEKKQADKTEQSKESEGLAIGLQMLLRNLGNEDTSESTFLRLPSAGDEGRPILLIPGVEGVAGNVWKTIAEQVNVPVYLLQLSSTLECESIPAIVDCIIDELCSVLLNGHDDFAIAAYSFGALVGIEIARCLQTRGIRGKLLLLDGAPKYLKLWSLKQLNNNPTDEETQKLVMLALIAMCAPDIATEKIVSVLQISAFEDQLEKVIELGAQQSVYSADYTRKMTKALCKRIKMAALLNLDEDQPLDLPIMLVRPTESSFADIEDDYGLSNYTTGAITQRMIEGNHSTMLENSDLVEMINSFNL